MFNFAIIDAKAFHLAIKCIFINFLWWPLLEVKNKKTGQKGKQPNRRDNFLHHRLTALISQTGFLVTSVKIMKWVHLTCISFFSALHALNPVFKKVTFDKRIQVSKVHLSFIDFWGYYGHFS